MNRYPKLVSIGEIIDQIPHFASEHARSSATYQVLSESARKSVVASGFANHTPEAVSLGCFGDIVFPFVRMGEISSLDLFGLDELIIFSFYWVNKLRYRRVADVGANLGLHSILMARCGWDVLAYEPDPLHIDILRRNLGLNNIKGVNLAEAAISDRDGTLEFVRVLGNTTSSHLVGAKKNAYGPLQRFNVRTERVTAIMGAVDLIKMDVEGQEAVIIGSTLREHWESTDMIVEIGSLENAGSIFNHLRNINVRAYAQKIGWNEVISFDEMPKSYKDGSLFITSSTGMNWK